MHPPSLSFLTAWPGAQEMAQAALEADTPRAGSEGSTSSTIQRYTIKPKSQYWSHITHQAQEHVGRVPLESLEAQHHSPGEGIPRDHHRTSAAFSLNHNSRAQRGCLKSWQKMPEAPVDPQVFGASCKKGAEWLAKSRENNEVRM